MRLCEDRRRDEAGHDDTDRAPMRKRFQKTVHRARKTASRTRALVTDRARRRAKLVGKRWQRSVVKPLRARRW